MTCNWIERCRHESVLVIKEINLEVFACTWHSGFCVLCQPLGIDTPSKPYLPTSCTMLLYAALSQEHLASPAWCDRPRTLSFFCSRPVLCCCAILRWAFFNHYYVFLISATSSFCQWNIRAGSCPSKMVSLSSSSSLLGFACLIHSLSRSSFGAVFLMFSWIFVVWS